MAKAFNLTAQLNLQGPVNIKPVIAQIKREFGTLKYDLKVNIDPKASKSIQQVTSNLKAMNAALIDSRSNADQLNLSLARLSSSLTSVSSGGTSTAKNLASTAANATTVSKSIRDASNAMQDFGKQSALAIKRFAAFSVITTGVYSLINALNSGYKSFLEFDKQLVRLKQVTGSGDVAIKSLSKSIINLSTTLGVSSSALTEVAVTLAQAGLTANQTEQALRALAKTELAPSFDNLRDTTEGAIAAMRQFGIQTQDLEAALGSINAVAAAFAVEASDIIAAIQRTGGVFASASKGVSEGKDALNEFIAVFTSVRATTRESAETIATGLRTIFTRIQRGSTIEYLKQFNINLQDSQGKFVGAYEAVRRLSEGLKDLDPRDVRFSQIVEELGGFRQIGKVIPLIQEFATAQQALGVAQRGQNSLTEAQATAQASLLVQITKVKEQFLALVYSVGQSQGFQIFLKTTLSLTSALIKLVGVFKPLLPILAIVGAFKGLGAIGQFATGFAGSFKKGGGARDFGETIGGTITGGSEKDKAEALARSSEVIRGNTDALNTLTSSVDKVDSTLNTWAAVFRTLIEGSGGGGGPKLNKGGKVLGFARGGIVPGTGNRDTVPAMLQPGEFVIRKNAVSAIGQDNLHRMNRYASGGPVSPGQLYSEKMKKYVMDNLDNNDSISFNKTIYGLQSSKNVKANTFENLIYDKLGGEKIAGNYPVDIINTGRGPVEVRNRQKRTPDYVLADKLMRYYLESNSSYIKEFTNKKNQQKDNIELGNIGIAYNLAKYQPNENYTELAKGGLIQKFALGGEALAKDVMDLGGVKGMRQLLGIRAGDRDFGKLLFAPNILAGKNLEAVAEYVRKAKEARAKGISAQQQAFAEARAGAFKVQIASILPIDSSFDETYDIEGRRVNIVGGGLLAQYADVIAEMQSEAAGLASRFAERLQGRTPAANTGRQAITPLDELMGQGNIEGAVLEKALALLGAPLLAGSSRTRPIDYPAGLGASAQYFKGLDSSSPTEVKRVIDKYSLEKTREEIARAFRENVFAKGGSPEDTVPALLTPGEFVINKKAAAKIGSAQLHRLNQADKMQGFNRGGSVGGIQSFAAGGFAGPDPIDRINVFADAAERAGQSLEKFSKDVVKSNLGRALQIEESRKSTRADLKTQIVRGIAGVGTGDTEQFGQDLRAKLLTLESAIDPAELDKQVKDLVDAIKAGGTNLDNLQAKFPVLSQAMDKTRDTTASLELAQSELADQFGGLINSVRLTEEQFAGFKYKESGKAKEDFGVLADIMDPQKLLAYRQSAQGKANFARAESITSLKGLPLVGKHMEKLGDAVAKLPGPIGAAVKNIGGMAGAVAVATSMLGDLIPQMGSFGDSVAGAGIGGALSGGGAMAANLGALGAQFGPQFAAIGLATGAVAGAIDGFIKAAESKKLEKTLRELNATMEEVDKSFKAYETDKSIANVERTQKAVAGVVEQRGNLESLAGRSFGEAAGSVVKGATLATGAVAALALATGTVLTGGMLLAAAAIGATVYGLGELGTALGLLPSSELDNEALLASLDTAQKYMDGLSKLAERRINLKSVEELDKVLKPAEDAIKNIEERQKAGRITAEQAAVAKRDVQAGAGRQSAAVQEAQIGALLRAGYAVDQNKPIQEQLKNMTSAAKSIAQAAADQAAIAAADAEILRQSGGNAEAAKAARRSMGEEGRKRRGFEILGEQELLISKQAKLAAVYRETSVEIENMINKLDKANAIINRFGTDLENVQVRGEAQARAATGEASLEPIVRENEQILGNMRAYNDQELQGAIDSVRNIVGPELGAQLEQGLQGRRVIQESLPDILARTDEGNVEDVVTQVRDLFGQAGISDELAREFSDQVRTGLQEGTGSRQGKSFDELLNEFPALQQAMTGIEKRFEVASNATKKHYDALEASRKYIVAWSEALDQSREYMLKADLANIEAQNKIAEARGEKLSPEAKNRAFYAQVRSLTGGPTSVEGIVKSTKDLEAEKARTTDSKKLQQINVQLNNNYKALQLIADNTSVLDNVLSAIQENNQRSQAAGAFTEKLFTGDPQDMAQAAMDVSLANALTGPGFDPNDPRFATLEGRQGAVRGLDYIESLGLEDEKTSRKRRRRAQLAMIESMSEDERVKRGLTKTKMVTVNVKDETAKEGYRQEQVSIQRAIQLDEQDQLVDLAEQEAAKQAEANKQLAEAATKSADANLKIADDIHKMVNDLPNNIKNAMTTTQAQAGAAGTTAAGAVGTTGNNAADNRPLAVGPGPGLEQEAKRKYEMAVRKAEIRASAGGLDNPYNLDEDLNKAKQQYENDLKEARALQAEFEKRRTRNREEDATSGILPSSTTAATAPVAAAAGAAAVTVPATTGATTIPAANMQMPSMTPSIDLTSITQIATVLTEIKTLLTSVNIETIGQVIAGQVTTALATTTIPLELSQTSRESLDNFNKNFGDYVTRLESIKFPDAIQLVGRHEVRVSINGAEAFETMQASFGELVVNEIDKSLQAYTAKNGLPNYSPRPRTTAPTR